MQIAPFEMERWQSVWENRVELNVSESGVEPMTLRDLLGETAGIENILNQRLGYPQTNGSEDLRAKIAALYLDARPENVLLTAGCAEANFLVTWLLCEPGDEIVFMMPNYMQVHGLARKFRSEREAVLAARKSRLGARAFRSRAARDQQDPHHRHLQSQ